MIQSASRWAPWLQGEEARQLAIRIASSHKNFTADALAERLNLTMQERTVLNIRTIDAVDATKEQRAKIAKQRRNERRMAKRRAQGVRPRAEYENQRGKPKPWETEGCSRATWYRRHPGGRRQLAIEEHCFRKAA